MSEAMNKSAKQLAHEIANHVFGHSCGDEQPPEKITTETTTRTLWYIRARNEIGGLIHTKWYDTEAAYKTWFSLAESKEYWDWTILSHGPIEVTYTEPEA